LLEILSKSGSLIDFLREKKDDLDSLFEDLDDEKNIDLYPIIANMRKLSKIMMNFSTIVSISISEFMEKSE
jgi:hypothetical protein